MIRAALPGFDLSPLIFEGTNRTPSAFAPLQCPKAALQWAKSAAGLVFRFARLDDGNANNPFWTVPYGTAGPILGVESGERREGPSCYFPNSC